MNEYVCMCVCAVGVEVEHPNLLESRTIIEL
jgi:hypothetical protein